MGCDIHSHAEVRNHTTGEWSVVTSSIFSDEYCPEQPFAWRSYGMFGFLANVRNYSLVPTIVADVPRGMPEDSPCAEDDYDESFYHSHSYVTLKELLDFDYDRTFEDRRITAQIAPNYWSGREQAEPGAGERKTFRQFLGPNFFKDIDALKTLGDPDNVRVVFWFDN